MVSRSDIELWLKNNRKIWSIHFIVTISVMIAGIIYNGGELKLIPSRTIEEGCAKSFVNVLTNKEDDATSKICCKEGGESSLLCLPFSPPLYKRLSKFPDAVFVPLFPVLIRGILLLWKLLFGDPSSEKITTFLRRSNFYMIVLFVRTFILFVGFNWLEDQIVTSYPSKCWFSKHARRSTCRGMEFDFSDHTVLYLGQILPIFLFEMVYTSSPKVAPNVGGASLTKFLIACLVYLYFLTLYGEFQTAAYFHTGEEILLGYVISLIIQVPLAYIQCSKSCETMREKLFGIPSTTTRQD